jgi:hypothetical protein
MDQKTRVGRRAEEGKQTTADHNPFGVNFEHVPTHSSTPRHLKQAQAN